MRLSVKLLLISEFVLLLAVLVLVVPVWQAMGRQVVTNMQNELKAIASTAALTLDGDRHATIRTLDDAASEAFVTLRAQLEAVRAANDIAINHIYTFYRDGEQMRFAVMLNPVEELFVGDPYPIQELMRPVLTDGTMEATRLYRDDNGEWISAYAPIRARDGSVVGVLEVDKSAEEYLREFRYHTRLTLSVGLLALGLSSFLGWWVLQWLVIRPVAAIRDGVEALGRREFTHKVAVTTRDELQDLGETLNSIAAQLDVARVVQQGFFPKAMPVHPAYRLAGQSTPCDATGGDYYDAFTLPDDHLAFVVADVSGHGLGPSLLMATCRAALRGLAHSGLTPGALVTELNQMMLEELHGGRFITLIYGTLGPRGTLVYSNYGHGPAFVVQAGSLQALESHRPPVGLDFPMPGAVESTLQLACGDRVFVASDGLTEAMDPQGRQLGPDAVAAIVADTASPAATIVERLHALQTRHCGGASTTDDVTLLCIDRV